MRRLAYFLMVLFSAVLQAQAQQKHAVYLIPGQGADSRLYKNIQLDSTFESRHIEYVVPEKGWDMEDYARELAKQVDTTRPFSIVGVSLGGMLATEMGDFLHPEKIVIVSSAKSKKELPSRYRFQKAVPIYKLVPKQMIKLGARILQPIVEPASKTDKRTFRSMLKDKDPDFMKRTVAMILEWDRESYREDIIHIHGDDDNTIPIRNISVDIVVVDGSHMMVLTQGELLSELLNNALLE